MLLISDSQGPMVFGGLRFRPGDEAPTVKDLAHTLEKASYTPELKEHPSTAFYFHDHCPCMSAAALVASTLCLHEGSWTVPIIRVLSRPLSREKLWILSYRLVLRGWIIVNPLISCGRIKMQMFQIHLACDKHSLWVTSAPCKSITFLISSRRRQPLRILPI